MTRKNRMKELAREKTLVRKRERGNKKKSGGGGEEEKNTMLLTVIAVATFAYFSLSLGNSSSSTTVTAGTEKIPTLTLETGAANLEMKLTAADMAHFSEEKTYYAVTNKNSHSQDTGGYYDTTASADTTASIGKLTIDEPGTTTYDCTVTITITEDDDPMIDALAQHEGEGILVLNGPSVGGSSDTKTIDLANFETDYTAPITINTTLNSSNTSRAYTAQLSLKNTTAEQNYLQDKELNLTIETSATCDIHKDAE